MSPTLKDVARCLAFSHPCSFERGYQLFANLEPYLQHALQV